MKRILKVGSIVAAGAILAYLAVCLVGVFLVNKEADNFEDYEW